jgi:hypothetical protein
MGKKSRSGSGMNITDHSSESLETIFLGFKYLNYLMRILYGKKSDPGWKKFGSGIKIPDPSGINFPDPQHMIETDCRERGDGGGGRGVY